MTPPYLKENLPQKRSLLYGNCNPHLYHEISCNNDRYMNSFFPNSIRSWNNIDVDFQSSPSLSSFKKNILNLIRPVPKSIFGIHDPLGTKYLLQLRVGLSPLRHHKKNHNFLDTPNDWCDCHCALEDTKHFLLNCHLYILPRQKLNTSIINILAANQLQHLFDDINLYLYGHHSLRFYENKCILLSTIIFIKETGRFS